MIKLTPRRKLLAGFMVAAVGGLTVDRLTAGAEEIAPAETPEQELISTTAAPFSDEATLAARLAGMCEPALRRPDTTRSPFSQALATSVDAAPAMRSIRWSQRVLSGVLIKSNGRHIAIVDGKAIPLGTQLDGLRLVTVTRNAVLFSDGETRITLQTEK